MDDMFPLTVTDGLNRTFELHQRPQRIVSLVPSLTEWLFDLGLSEEIVGVTKFCVHPKEARRTRRIVGGTKNIRIDAIQDLQPDLIVANREENDRDSVESLMASFPTYVSDVRNLEMALHHLQQIAHCCGKQMEADPLIQRIQEQFEWPAPDRRPTCVYLIWQEPYMSVSADKIGRAHV